jgi:quinol monooxygenase YgiN
MLIIAGVMEVDPERREEFLQSKVEGMLEWRAEAGCLEFVFGADPVVPGRVVLFERWEDKASLAAHLVTLRAKPPVDPATQVPVLSAQIQQYEIGAIGTVGS